MWSFRRRIFVLMIVVGSVGIVQGQTNSEDIRPKGNSPYSRFGLGDFVNQYYAAAAGMGGLTAGFQDPYNLNTENPASLASLQSTAFEVGFFAKYADLQGRNGASDKVWSGNLNYLALGFPLINPISKVLDKRTSPWNYGMSLSLQPYHTVAYDIRADVNYGEDIEVTTNIFKGNGGTYRFLWGNGIKYKNLAAGISLGYLFGKMSNSRRIEFDSLDLAYGTEFLDEISVSGFIWNAGLQYTLEFGEKDRNQFFTKRLTLGVYGNNSSNFDTNTSRLYTRTNFYTATDTLIYEVGAKRKGTLPSQLTAGIVYEQLNKFKIGAEYSTGKWSEYQNEAKPETLADASRLAFGLEYIPEYNSYDSYLRRMRYRAGFIYTKDPRVINNDQIKEYIVTIGAGFPIIMPRQQISFINLSIEAGQFGITDAIKENFVRMTLGFTLNDNTWFFKRKFN
ncbi:MAG: hypothetical protein SFU99_07585 [Saprospiraceae bacterium]|nr:hypothetical protein [Saprospiraceae bacterium]